MENLDKDWVLGKLFFLGINLTPRALQLYVSEGLIPAPASFLGKGQGARAIYPPETVAEAYAAYHLLHEDRLRYDRLREARQIGRYLETTDYHSLKDIMADTAIRVLIFRKPKETFFAFEWLWLKYSMLPGKELAVNSGIRGILIGLAETGDGYVEALLSGEDREVENLPIGVKAIIQDRQKKGKAVKTSLEVTREVNRILRTEGEAAAHEYLRKIKAEKQS